MGGETERILEAVCRCVCPPSSDTVMRAVASHVSESIAHLPPLQRRGFLAALHSFNVSSIARHRRLFSRLDHEQRVAHLERWQHGVTSQFHRALCSLIRFGYYEQPEVMEAIGYTPQQWIEKVDARRQAHHADVIKTAAQQVITPDALRKK